MSLKKWSVVLGVLVIASMILTACPAPAPQVVEKVVTQVVEKEVKVVETQVVETVKEVEKIVEVVATAVPEVEAKTLHLNMGPGDIPTIDPALATDTSSVQIIWLTFGGVTFQHEETNEVQPGIATEWSASDEDRKSVV